MSKEYQLELTNKAAKKYKKLTLNNEKLANKLQQAFVILVSNPFDIRLKTHKVNLSGYGILYSSKVTSDIRIIWELDNEQITIIVLDIGGHSGRRGVYK
jgi:mRNA-degrading endonuclease YafQ of YafQ-DinJ toxin-antitoxin module